MRVRYVCDVCGASVGDLHLDVLDEQRLGFTALTPEERADIIRPDGAGGLIVASVCDDCADTDTGRDQERLIH